MQARTETGAKPALSLAIPRSNGLALAMGSAALFSGKAIVVKLAYRDAVDPATLILYRMLFAVPLFAIALWWSSRRRDPLTLADHLRLSALGLVGYYAASMADFVGLQYVTAALERLVLYLTPTLVLLGSAIWLRRPVARREILALALSYGGIVLVFLHDAQFSGAQVVRGVAWVFASAVCYACYLTGSGQMVKQIGAIRLTSYAMCVSTAACVLQFLILRPWSALAVPPRVIELSVFNGVCCTVLPVFGTMMAVARIGAPRTSLAGNVGPVATIAFGALLLGEAVSARQLAGTALVLLGVYVLSTAPKVADSAAAKAAA